MLHVMLAWFQRHMKHVLHFVPKTVEFFAFLWCLVCVGVGGGESTVQYSKL